jgi:hypothetical protein
MRPILLALALLTTACGFALAANAQASHDGEILGAGQAGKLITTTGTWTFSNQEGADGNFGFCLTEKRLPTDRRSSFWSTMMGNCMHMANQGFSSFGQVLVG